MEQNLWESNKWDLLKAVTDSIGGTFADQWKEIITVQAFDEHTAVSPGILQENNNNVEG